MTTFSIIAGMAIGFVLALGVFLATVPLYINLLVNRPGGQEKSGFHLFTYPEEGKVKIVVRGDVIVRMIMIFADHKFAGTGAEPPLSKSSKEYWQIIEDSDAEINPLEGISRLLYPWAWYVYSITGAVFTGIYPFQRVREYLLERTTMSKDESHGGNNIVLEVDQDYSDHFRVRQFLYPFRIAQADTKDKISVNILLVLRARIVNPHMAAFGVDRWDQQLVNMATNTVSNFTRTRNLDEVLTATDQDSAVALREAVLSIKDDELHYGIDIVGVDIIDISPNLADEEKKKLYAEALAKTLGAATVIDGQSRAEALTAINEANAKGGEHALETLRTEALVRAAAATKGTVILSSGGTSTDPIQAAILAQLQQNNKDRT